MGASYREFIKKVFLERFGEHVKGLVVKFDSAYSDTGKLYIEIAEKKDLNNSMFIPSGIYRSDNTWLYVVGDYQTVYVFSKEGLVELRNLDKYPEIEVSESRGYLLPESVANRHCLHRWKFTDSSSSRGT